MSGRRSFTVTEVAGHIDVTQLSSPGPQFFEVMVTASNATGETVQFRRSITDQPHVGDVVHFDEVPDSAIRTKPYPSP